MKPHPTTRSTVRSTTVLTTTLTTLTIVIVMALSGCGATLPGGTPMHTLDSRYQPDEEETYRAIEELMDRPSIEEILPTSIDLMTTIREGLDAEFGPITWRVDDPDIAGRPSCSGIYINTGGTSFSILNVATDRKLEGDEWTRAVQIITDLAAPYGYDHPVYIVNTFENHGMTLQTNRKGNLDLVSNNIFSFRISSECYLTEATKQNIREYGVPDPQYWPYDEPGTTHTPTQTPPWPRTPK